MNRKDAPEEAKVYLDILDHYYVGKCPCKDLVDGEKINEVIQYCRDVYDIFYTPDGAELEKDWKAEGIYIHPDDDDSGDYDDEISAVEWKARYEAERKMRMELQSKVFCSGE